MDINEKWSNIEGFDDKYEISSMGRIKIKENVSQRINNGTLCDYRQKEMFKAIRIDTSKNVYTRVSLSTQGKSKTAYLHRLVAKAFIPNPNNLPEVNHINGKKYDNGVENLEWNSKSQQMTHAMEVLGFKPNTTGINDRQAVYQIDKDTDEIIKSFESIKQATEATGATHISGVCLGNRKTVGGFKWKYK